MKLNWKTMEPRERDAAVAMSLFPEIKFNPKWLEISKTVPRFTTSPAACAEVKAKFEAWDIRKRNGGVVVSIRIKGEPSYATAPTEEEAFCKAALRASGMEVEG